MAVQHFQKLIKTFHKDYLEKPTATSPPVDTTPSMARPIIRLETQTTKQKRGRPVKANGAKRAKKS